MRAGLPRALGLDMDLPNRLVEAAAGKGQGALRSKVRAAATGKGRLRAPWFGSKFF